MSTIVLRQTKGSALTFAEGDANFSNLNTDKLEDITNESIGDLSDVTVSNPQDGQVLKLSQGSWINSTDSGIALSDLSVGAEEQASGNGGIGYNSGTGVFTYTPPTASGIGAATLGDISVGAEAQASGNGGIGYNSGTGVFTYTPPTASGIGAIANLVEDTTPQLGGNLDGQGNKVEDVELDNYKETIYSLGSTDTPTIDVANGNVQSVTITSGLTLPAFSNAETGQSVTLLVTGSGTASGTAAYKFAGGATTLTTLSVVSIFYNGTNYFTSIATDFQ